MAKTGVLLEVDPGVVAKATELKREIQRLVKTIVEETDDELLSLGAIDQTHQLLSALKDLKLRKTLSFNVMHQKEGEKIESLSDFPQEFRCPISKKLMCDPVIVSTGQVCTQFLDLGLFCFLGFKFLSVYFGVQCFCLGFLRVIFITL